LERGASGPLTSPTMIRSGLSLRAWRSSERIVTSPAPSTLAGCDSNRMMCPDMLSSAASSTVMIRSVGPTVAASAFSTVVFPAPVAPATRMLSRCSTAEPSKSAPSLSTEPCSTSASRSATEGENLRIATTGPSTAAGGMIACNLEPSPRRASTAGEAVSILRPRGVMRRLTRVMSSSGERNTNPECSRTPDRSTHTSSNAFTSTSLTVSSATSDSSGPSPTSASTAISMSSGWASGATSGCNRAAACRRECLSRGWSEDTREATIRSTAPI
jgi:hypothetical protein